MCARASVSATVLSFFPADLVSFSSHFFCVPLLHLPAGADDGSEHQQEVVVAAKIDSCARCA